MSPSRTAQLTPATSAKMSDVERSPERASIPCLPVVWCEKGTKEYPLTPRPELDVDLPFREAKGSNRSNGSNGKSKKNTPLKILTASDYSTMLLVDTYRKRQLQKIMRTSNCSIDEAIDLAEDPDPYDKSYIFYCLFSAHR